jgi:hypothetical protein
MTNRNSHSNMKIAYHLAPAIGSAKISHPHHSLEYTNPLLQTPRAKRFSRAVPWQDNPRLIDPVRNAMPAGQHAPLVR